MSIRFCFPDAATADAFRETAIGAMITQHDRIMIYGVVEFKTAAGEALAISIPRTGAAMIRHFQAQAR